MWARLCLIWIAFLGGCHLIFPFEYEAGAPRSDAADAQVADLTHDVTGLDAGKPADNAVDAPAVRNRVLTGELTMGFQAMTITPDVIDPIDPSHAFVLCSFRTDGPHSYCVPTCQLDASGRLVVALGAYDPKYTVQVRYHVVQLAGARVQRKSISFGLADSDLTWNPLSPVDRGSSFVLVTSRSALALENTDERRTVMASLEPLGEVWLSRAETKIEAHAELQLVELQGAVVQHGQTTITAGNTSAAPEPINGLDFSRSLLLFSVRAGPDADGVEGVYMVRGRLDTTMLVFDRLNDPLNDVTGTVDISWSVVEIPGAVVLHDYNEDTPDKSSFTGSTNGSVDPARTVPIHSATIRGDSATNQEIASLTVKVISPDTVQFDRLIVDTATIGYSWSMFQLPP